MFKIAIKGKIKINQDNVFNDFYPETESNQIIDFQAKVKDIISDKLYFRKPDTYYNIDDKVLLSRDFIGIYLVCIKAGTTSVNDLSYLPDNVEDQEVIIDGLVKWKINKTATINSFKCTAIMDTASNWKNKNPILEKGQIGVEQDTCFIKVGDGNKTWQFLDYISTPLLDTKLDKDATAQKAIRDKRDQVIDETYVKDVSIEHNTIKVTKGNNVENSFNIEKVSYNNATINADGLMSKEDKAKLNSIKENAEENQNAFSNISVGSITLNADTKTDTLNIKSGNNISIEANDSDDSITISFSGDVENSGNALKATQDSLGQNIHETYIKDITSNDNILTVKKGNNTTTTVEINNVPIAQKTVKDNRSQIIDKTYIKDITLENGSITIYRGDNTTKGIELTGNDQLFPIGYVYISTVPTNPATLFRVGNWKKLPAGRVLLAEGISEWGTEYQAGSKDGESKHTLLAEEIPHHNHNGRITPDGSSHTHDLTMRASHGESGNGGEPRFGDGDVWSGEKTKRLSAAGEHTHNLIIENFGGDRPHNNMQPYLSVYMWERIG